MMDKFSLIGLGCFKIFKGNTLWMRLRGLTIQPLFEECVVDSTTSKNSDLGCSIDGFKYPVPTCYTPTPSPLPLDSSQQKKTWKNESKNHPKNLKGINPPQIPSLFFPIWLSITPNTPTKIPSPGWEAWRENAINFPICPQTEHSHCRLRLQRLQPKRFHLGVQNVRRYAKSLSGVVFFLCTRTHPSKG